MRQMTHTALAPPPSEWSLNRSMTTMKKIMKYMTMKKITIRLHRTLPSI
jgi:hypothetical protein